MWELGRSYVKEKLLFYLNTLFIYESLRENSIFPHFVKGLNIYRKKDFMFSNFT